MREIIVHRDASRIARESTSLTCAIGGDDAIRPHQINMGESLTRSKEVRDDLLRLTLPPAIGISVFTNVLSQAFQAAILAASVIPASNANVNSDVVAMMSYSSLLASYTWNDALMEIGTSVVILALSYLFVVLPAAQVIISERDDQLARGIDTACKVVSQRVAASTAQDRSNGDDTSTCNARVVAVLGMLHVNGVAKRLLDVNVSDDEAEGAVLR